MFKLKHLFMVLFGVALIFGALYCSSSSSGDDDDDSGGGVAAASSGAAITAAFASLSGESNISEPEARIPTYILKHFIRTAIAQDGIEDICDAIALGLGPDEITMSTDGTDGTYGNPSNPLVVEDGGTYSFCDDGGDVAAWEIFSSSPLSTTCTDADDAEFTVSMSGSGVVRNASSEGSYTTYIRGEFTVTAGDDSITADCSFDASGGTFSGSCEGVDPASSDITCEDPADESDDDDDSTLDFAGDYTISDAAAGCGETINDGETITSTETETNLVYSIEGGAFDTILTVGEELDGSCTLSVVEGGDCESCDYTVSGGSSISFDLTCGSDPICTFTASK